MSYSIQLKRLLTGAFGILALVPCISLVASPSSAAALPTGYCMAIADRVQIGWGNVSGTGHVECYGTRWTWDELKITICVQYAYRKHWLGHDYKDLECSSDGPLPWRVVGGGTQTPLLSGFHLYRIRIFAEGTFQGEPIHINAHSASRGHDPD